MADFCQNGVITTLQKLNARPVGEIERELKVISQKRKMVLLLPALVSEFDGDAMPKIIEELKGVDYLYQDRALSGPGGAKHSSKEIRKIMSILPVQARVIWHDGPRMQTLLKELMDADFKLDHPG